MKGIRVYKNDGKLLFSSGLASYVFDRKISAVTTVTSYLPPLVFSRTEDSNVAVRQARVTEVGVNQWEVRPSYWSRHVLPDNVHSEVSSASLDCWVFVVRPASSGGYGLRVVDPNGHGFSAGSGGDLPLVIKRRCMLDPNTAPKALSSSYPPLHGRRVEVGSPAGKWAASVGAGLLGAVPLFSSWSDDDGDVQYLGDSQGYFIGGVSSHVRIDATSITSHAGQHTGPEHHSNTQLPDYFPVWLIDTDLYG